MPNTTPSLHLRIISPQQLILEADVDSVSSQNTQGKFDILPLHANFISLIDGKPIVVRKKGEKTQAFNFPIAIVICLDNKVDIYTYTPSQNQANS